MGDPDPGAPRASERAALVALLGDSGSAGWSVNAEGLQARGGPRAELERRLGLFAESAELAAAERIARWRERGIATLTCSDSGYPRRLAELRDRPLLLFVRGALVPSDDDGVAVIGSRHASPSGLRVAANLAEALVASGRTVISGLASGIDTAAHTAALAAGGRSIAVLGNGVDRVYPAMNARLQQRMPALVSQFWPAQAPNRETFPQRNAVMAGMSLATVIVEAGARSGARIQARHAVAQGRGLYLAAGCLREAWARGLVADAGATIIDSAADLLDGLARCRG